MRKLKLILSVCLLFGLLPVTGCVEQLSWFFGGAAAGNQIASEQQEAILAGIKAINERAAQFRELAEQIADADLRAQLNAIIDSQVKQAIENLEEKNWSDPATAISYALAILNVVLEGQINTAIETANHESIVNSENVAISTGTALSVLLSSAGLKKLTGKTGVVST